MSASLLGKLQLEGSSALAAPLLIELMRTDFSIPAEFTSQEARLVLGVLYPPRPPGRRCRAR